MQEKLASLLPLPLLGLILAAFLLWLTAMAGLAVARLGARQAVPERLALGSGALAGLSLGVLAVQTGPVAPRLNAGDILIRGRWWDTELTTLLAETWAPSTAAIGFALQAPVQSLPSAPATLAMLTMVAAAATLAISLFAGQARRVVAMLAAAIGLAAVLAILLPSIVLLLAWTAGQLNFWLFAVAGIAWQYARHGHL